MMPEANILAEFFRYPAPGRLDLLRQSLDPLPEGGFKQSCSAFLDRIQTLTLGEWEELYTRTLDINPPAAPYVGYQVWGESYPRGKFLAQMSRLISEAGVDTDGELPDHLLPVLHYLDACSQPAPELLEALPPAIKKMQALLRKADPANPYNLLLEAVGQVIHMLTGEPI